MKNYIPALVLILAVIGVALTFGERGTLAGSVGGAYTFKHYTSANASSTARTLVKGGAGELGTITINTTGAQVLRLYDGASTTVATTSSTITPIAVLKASVGEQTFTYEANVLQGVLLEMPATYAGDVTITVR